MADQHVDVVVEDLKRYGDELVPGGAEALGAVWGSSLGGLSADARAAEIEKRMGSGFAARYKNPEHVPAKLENGADPSPVRKVLSRYSDQLQPGAVDKLTAQLGPKLAGRPSHDIAREVVKFIHSRDGADYTSGYREPPAHEQTTRDRLRTNFPEMSERGLQALARDKGHDLARMGDRQFVSIVAASLRSSVVASKYGVWQTINQGDPRLTGQPSQIGYKPAPTPKQPDPPRNPQTGQFEGQQQPAEAPRRRSSFF